MAVDTVTPKITDPEWHDYVMSQFVQEEVVDGKPLVTGLRRVSEKLLGQIVESVSKVKDYPRQENNYRAVVEHLVVFKHNGYNLKYTGAADIGPDNTAEPFSNFPVATAETIAEGRALKRALKLRGQLYEELVPSKGAETVDVSVNIDDMFETFTTSQRIAVNKLSKQLNVDPTKVFGGVPVSNEDGISLLAKLNGLVQNMDADGVPEEFKPFVKLEA